MVNTKNNNYLSLTVWVSLLIFIGAVIGTFTKTEISSWYSILNQSPLTPPNYVFPIVWSILYAVIGVTGWIIWNSRTLPALGLVKKLYIIQLLLNWSWSFIFFNYHLTGLALICLSMIIIIVTLIIIKTYKKLKIVALMLTPYLIWLLFAAHLNFYIWQNN